MLAEMARQDQLANDLANASTPGYKADRVSQRSFGDLMLSNSTDGSVVGPLGAGAAIDKQVTDVRPQAMRDTGQPLDLAVEGDGWFGVQTKQGVRYTRNGSFSADAQGKLVDQLGNQVLGVGGKPVAVTEGTIDPTKVALFNLRNPVKQGDSNFTGQAGGQATGTVQLRLSGGLGRRPGPRHDRPHGLHAHHGGHPARDHHDRHDAAADLFAGRHPPRLDGWLTPG